MVVHGRRAIDMGVEKSTVAAAKTGAPHTQDAGRASWSNERQTGGRPGCGLAPSLGGNGQPLTPELQVAMQSRFAYDFSHVRIHADDRAAAVADAIGANAFTVENHIVFGTDKFAPHDPDGKRLIAHELAHVVQQQPRPRDAMLPTSFENLTLGRDGDATEREAERAAERVARGESVVIRVRAQNRLQADWVGAGIGALAGGVLGGIAGALVGGPIGALIGGGIGLLAGAIIGGLATGSKFPSYREIVGDTDVQTAITSAWSNTETAANATSRREEGFWIRLNTGTGKYEFTSTILGPSVGPTAGGSVVLGSRPADTNAGTEKAVYTVASFHTHTPTAFRPVGRAVGPSEADHRVDKSDDVVGVVYDYVESPKGSGNIPAGHPIGSPAQPYHSGPNRRQKE